eukprot:1160231-Pelagomonas_calceolata.AAC.3
MEFMSRMLYFNAIAKYGLLSKGTLAAAGLDVRPYHFALTGFWVLVYMWLKVRGGSRFLGPCVHVAAGEDWGVRQSEEGNVVLIKTCAEDRGSGAAGTPPTTDGWFVTCMFHWGETGEGHMQKDPLLIGALLPLLTSPVLLLSKTVAVQCQRRCLRAKMLRGFRVLAILGTV